MRAIARKNKGAIETASVAEVATLWSDTTLDVTQLGFGPGEKRGFTVGETPTADCWIQPAVLGGSSEVELVGLEGEQVVLRAPSGAPLKLERPEMTIDSADEMVESGLARRSDQRIELPLEEGWIATVDLGEVKLQVRRTRPGKLVMAAPPVDWSAMKLTGASLLVHAAFLALVFAIPPEPSTISIDGLQTGNRFVSYLVAPPEINTPDVPDFVEQSQATNEPDEAPEQGSAHAGEGGMMGNPESDQRNHHYTIRDRGGDQLNLASAPDRDSVVNSGILAVLRHNVPTSPFATGGPNGFDAEDQLGALLGVTGGESFGYGGLTVAGTGRGGNGLDGSISLGTLNTFGRVGSRGTRDGGRDQARLDRRGHRTTGPVTRHERASVGGSLPRETIRRQIRLRHNEISHCYQRELNRNPDLEGRVAIAFIIDTQGRVAAANVATSSVASPAVGQCVARVIRRISFPAPDIGVVRVTYPFTFVSSH